MRPVLLIPLTWRGIRSLLLHLVVLLVLLAVIYLAFGLTAAIVGGLLVGFVLRAIALAIRS